MSLVFSPQSSHSANSGLYGLSGDPCGTFVQQGYESATYGTTWVATGYEPKAYFFPAPASVRASFQIIDESVLLSRDAEELSAQRIVLEMQMVIEESQREEFLSHELREIHFAHAVNVQVQQELQHWEQQKRERAAYEMRFSIDQHQLGQEVAQQNYRREVESLQYFQRLRAEMVEAETTYRTSVQEEAETFAQQLREEIVFKQIPLQTQSLLSAERQQYDKNLKEQAERWQGSLDMVVEGATKELQECKEENQELIAELNQAQQDLWDWEVYYQEQPQAPDPFAKSNEK